MVGDTDRTAGPPYQGDVPYHMTSCSENEGCENIWANGICLTKKLLFALLSWKWLSICLLMWSRECFACACSFALPLVKSNNNFTFAIGQPHLVGGNPGCSRGVGSGWSLRSLSTQAILWFYECLYLSPWVFTVPVLFIILLQWNSVSSCVALSCLPIGIKPQQTKNMLFSIGL